MFAFHEPPSIVLPAAAGAPLKIHFLEGALPDVSDEKISRQAIKTESPRIAQPEGPNFRTRIADTDKRIAGRNPVRQPMIHIESQQFTQEHLPVLSIVRRIPAASAVTDSDVKEAIRTKLKLAAIVVSEIRMRNRDDFRRGIPVGNIAIACRNTEPGNLDVAFRVRVVNKKQTVGAIIGVKRKPEQPLFSAARNQAGDI